MIPEYLKYLDEMEVMRELSLVVSTDVKKILYETPMVSKKEFWSSCEPADIMVTFTPKSRVKTTGAQLFTQMLSTMQRSPYSSSKIVMSRDILAGYGIVDRGGESPQLDKYSLPKYIGELQEAILIRVPNLENSQKSKITSFIKSRIGLDYASTDLVKSAWDRFFKGRLGSMMKGREMDPKALDQIRDPLICSTIISVAYRAAGVKVDFTEKPYEVWPRDFMLSDNTQKVCRIGYG